MKRDEACFTEGCHQQLAVTASRRVGEFYFEAEDVQKTCESPSSSTCVPRTGWNAWNTTPMTLATRGIAPRSWPAWNASVISSGSQVKATGVDRFEHDGGEEGTSTLRWRMLGGCEGALSRRIGMTLTRCLVVSVLFTTRVSRRATTLPRVKEQVNDTSRAAREEKGKGKYRGNVGDNRSGKGSGRLKRVCHWYGELGHSQPRCRWWDEYQERVRGTRAEHARRNVEAEEEEEDTVETTDLECLEVKESRENVVP